MKRQHYPGSYRHMYGLPDTKILFLCDSYAKITTKGTE